MSFSFLPSDVGISYDCPILEFKLIIGLWMIEGGIIMEESPKWLVERFRDKIKTCERCIYYFHHNNCW